MIEDMKIFHKTYEFLKWLHTLLNKFPKSEKYTMAQKIENTSLNFLECMIQSNNEFDKKIALQEAIIELDKLRIFFRLSKDLQFISFEQYEYGCKLIDEIGRMLGGWYKVASPKEKNCINSSAQVLATPANALNVRETRSFPEHPENLKLTQGFLDIPYPGDSVISGNQALINIGHDKKEGLG